MDQPNNAQVSHNSHLWKLPLPDKFYILKELKSM